MKGNTKRKDTWFGWLLIAPSLIGVCIFVLLPFADVVRRSFSQTMTHEFIGIQNYKMVVTNSAFLLAMKNTVLFLLTCIPLLLLSSFLVSLLLQSIKRFQEFFKSVLLVPMAIPAASIVLLWRMFFHDQGFLNKMLGALSITPKNYLNSKLSFAVLVFTYIWKNIGYDIVLWSAGLSNIATELYDAAAIDGANTFKKLRFITLPQLKPTIFITTVLSVVNSFKVFREAYLISGNYPNQSIYMLQNLFNNWFTSLDIQKLTSAAVIMAIGIWLLIQLLQRFTRED